MNVPTVLQSLLRLEYELGSRIGVAAKDLQDGAEVRWRADEAFHAGSTYKVLIAAELLRRIDRRELDIQRRIPIKEWDVHPGSGPIKTLGLPLELTIRDLIRYMIRDSDNTASDIVLRLAGGSRNVTASLRRLGYPTLRVDRPTSVMIGDTEGIHVCACGRITPAEWQVLKQQVDAATEAYALRRFRADPRDTATPLCITTFMSDLWTGKLLSASSTSLLLHDMHNCRNGARRLQAGIPANATLAHKTGSIGGTASDIGVVTLGSGGHIAISVFVANIHQPYHVMESQIATVGAMITELFATRSIAV